MKLKETHLRGIIVVLTILLLSLFLLTNKKEMTYNKQVVLVDSLTKKVNILQKQNDSLNDELYPCLIELNRHQIGYQILLRRNPKAAEQLGDIISDETE